MLVVVVVVRVVVVVVVVVGSDVFGVGDRERILHWRGGGGVRDL